MNRPIPFVLAAALIATGCASTESPPAHAGAQASIPFLNHGGVYNWSADGDRAIYLQDRFRNWYHATLFSSCRELSFATAIGIETRGTDTLDNFGTIIVRGQRCPIQTLVKSAPPPKKLKRHKGDADKAAPAR